MKSELETQSGRMLIVDDLPEIHELFTRIMQVDTAHQPQNQQLDVLEAELFQGPQAAVAKPTPRLGFTMDHAYQGQQAVDMVKSAQEEGKPYFLAFVDMRMPPGMDGVETIKQMWKFCPDLYTVICTAYSDYGWQDIVSALGATPNLLLLRKPFESIEVRQIASAISKMYGILAGVRQSMDRFDAELISLTHRLAVTEARTQVLGSVIEDAVLMLDAKSHIVSANPAAERLLGMRTADLLGQRAINLIDLPGGEDQELKHNAASGEPKRLLGKLRSQNREVEILIFPVSLPSDTNLEQIFVVRHI